MLQVMRDKSQGFLTWVIIIIIAGVFAILGLNDYFNAKASGSIAASINGEPISWRSVDRLYQRILQEQEVPVGNEQALKAQIVAALAQQKALLSGLQKQHFIISREQAIHELKKNPVFATEGTFSKDQFKSIMAQAGYSESEYIQDLSQEMLRNQFIEGLSLSSFTSKQELARAIQLLDQTRNFSYLTIPARQYHEGVSKQISEDEIKQYYDAHVAQFVLKERVSIDYIELSVDRLMPEIPVREADLKAFYEQNLNLFSQAAEVHARHILISTLNSEPLAAKQKAEDILLKIKQGEDFAVLAKTESNDTMTGPKGGDLGWFGRGAMVLPLEEAIFNLKQKGEVAGPIQTDYGYHIVELLDRKEALQRSFEESKALVEEHYRRNKAESLFKTMQEKGLQVAQQSENDLKPIALALNIPLKTTALFERQETNSSKADPNPIGGADTGITERPEIRKAAFGTAVLVNGKNSPWIRLNDIHDRDESHVVMIHVNRHEPARQQSLEEARAQILERLTFEKASDTAKKQGEALVSSIQKGQSADRDAILADLSKAQPLEWVQKLNVTRADPDLDRIYIKNAFQLPGPDTERGTPSVTGFALPNGDYVVLKVTQLKLGDLSKMDKATQTAYQKSMAEMHYQIESGLYINEILRKSKVKFFEQTEE